MVFIFDLDYTLLDTKRFKEKLAGIFYKENFLADYNKHFKGEGVNFDKEIYFRILRKQSLIDENREKELRQKIAALIKGLKKYLYPEVEKILKHLRKNGNIMILATFGDKKWQAEKVKKLKIKKNFDRVVFEDKNKNKSSLLKKLKKSPEKILIINDNAKETKEMTIILGERAEVFLVKGPYTKNIKHNWPIHALNELL
jgi:FMN phosphatase YigB (HAD superfamily)